MNANFFQGDPYKCLSSLLRHSDGSEDSARGNLWIVMSACFNLRHLQGNTCEQEGIDAGFQMMSLLRNIRKSVLATCVTTLIMHYPDRIWIL